MLSNISYKIKYFSNLGVPKVERIWYNRGMEMEIKCPKCGKEEIWKSGKTGGKQQYQCKSCKRKFITEKNYSEEFKQKAIAIFYEGNSGRAVGRIMGINKSTVYNWIKKLDEKLQDVDSVSVEENIAVQAEQTEVIEMDELFDHINEKKTELT